MPHASCTQPKAFDVTFRFASFPADSTSFGSFCFKNYSLLPLVSVFCILGVVVDINSTKSESSIKSEVVFRMVILRLPFASH